MSHLAAKFVVDIDGIRVKASSSPLLKYLLHWPMAPNLLRSHSGWCEMFICEPGRQNFGLRGAILGYVGLAGRLRSGRFALAPPSDGQHERRVWHSRAGLHSAPFSRCSVARPLPTRRGRRSTKQHHAWRPLPVFMNVTYRPLVGGDPRHVLVLGDGMMVAAAIATLLARAPDERWVALTAWASG